MKGSRLFIVRSKDQDLIFRTCFSSIWCSALSFVVYIMLTVQK